MLESLVIEGTNKTPKVTFTAEGKLEISGKSIPENSIEFYQQLYSWLDNYAQSPAASTELKIQLEYFNTSSSKCLLDIFRKLEAIKKEGRSAMVVYWHYEAEDEDMEEAGQDYDYLIDLPFQLISF